jgi:hypothetical protein
VISRPFRFLLDLNTEALYSIKEAIGLTTGISFTGEYLAEGVVPCDYRYIISPKKPSSAEGFSNIQYTQVFSGKYGFVPGLSIIDVLLNNGPGTGALLLGSLA